MKRDLLTLESLTNDEVFAILGSAVALKSDQNSLSNQLKGKNIGLLFQKPSNRTRVSFEVGINHLGGNCLYLSPREIDLGKRESTADVAKTLSRYLDCIVARTNLHSDIIELGKEATIPVINGLSDLYHPCQALADIFSIIEKLGENQKVIVSYIGDGNNVCHSLLLGCAKVGYDIRIATPPGYEPNADVIKAAKEIAQETNSDIVLTQSPQEAVKDAHVIYADVWVSMGQEEEAKQKVDAFQGFQINKDLVQLADSNYIFMHCLPAHRGLEVTAGIIDGPHSIVFDQAENRMHVQKAVLNFLLGDQK